MIENKAYHKDQLRDFVSDGLCFNVSNDVKGQMPVDNWICEDDLDLWWEKNCIVLRPHINTCIDKLASAKIKL